MTEPYYRLPLDLASDIDAYEQNVRSFLAGDLTAGFFRAKRVPRGIYEQRQDGTHMVRVRVAGGTLTNEQIQELAKLSDDFGNGLLHVTTRQDVQLHSISIGDTPTIMRRLMTVGLASKGGGGNTVRNVTACPYAGICSSECFDVTPFAHAVTEYLIPLVGSYNLPRKYKISFSGCAADCALAQVADLGFVAEAREGQPGFRVFAGGGMGAYSRVADTLLDWTPVSEVVRIAETVRRLFDLLGNRSNKHRARLRFVFDKIGVAAFGEQFAEQLTAVTREGVPEWRGSVALVSPTSAEAPGPPLATAPGNTRVLPQRQPGLVAIPLHLPLGFVPAGDFARIGDVAEQFSGEQGLRTSRLQNLLIRFVAASDVGKLRAELQRLETDVFSPVALERFIACAGASTCRLGLCLARDAARACADRLTRDGVDAETLDALDFYINGCSNACGQQPIGPIGLFGVAQRVEGRLVPCYHVTLGGRCGPDGARLGAGVGQVPAKALPALFHELVSDFQAHRQNGETFSTFFDRMGETHFKGLVARHAGIPAYSERPEFYRDFGTDEDFSLAGRGAGECGSGVFELIQEELTAARKAKEPFDTVLSTTRGLLITRGVDAQDPDTVFREFEKHFLDTGLVAEEFRPLLSRARGYSQGWQQAFDGYEEAVGKLLERVELLYSTLDANLEFHPPEGRDMARRNGGESPAPDTAVELDLRGVACPMNFVKSKLRLESMDVGETLAIVLDDGEPIRNVPASFRNEGQTIEETTDLGDGHWRVTVRKTK